MKNLPKLKVLEQNRNQMVIEVDEVRFLISYDRVIAASHKLDVVLDIQWNYSMTTQKHLNAFLRSDKKTIEKTLAARLYRIEDLN